MLAHCGIISPEDRDAIHAGLETILGEITDGSFVFSTELEDIHMNIDRGLPS